MFRIRLTNRTERDFSSSKDCNELLGQTPEFETGSPEDREGADCEVHR